MKKTEKLNTLQEAHRIADEMRRFGKAVGYSWAFDTVRWLLRDATPDGMMVSSDGNNTETARYFFRERTW